MALQDRDYYREDDDRDWSFLPGRVTSSLVIGLIVIFMLQVINRPPQLQGGTDMLAQKLGFRIDLVQNGEVWRAVTAPLVHDSNSIFPIACCLLALFLCGRWVEDELGGREYGAYLIVALVVTQALEFVARLTGLLTPAEPSFGSIGVVTSLVVLCAVRHPRTTVNVFVFPVPMAFVAILWVLLSAVDLRGFDGRGGLVRVLAGSAFAATYHHLHMSFTSRRGRRAPPRLRVVHPDDDMAEVERRVESDEPKTPVTSGRNRGESKLDEHLEAKVDHVLEKVARSGRDSLTADEKAVLLKAGEIYRKRRGN